MPAGKILLAAVCVMALMVGAAVIYNAMPKTTPVTPSTMVVSFSAIDKLAGSQDAVTSAVQIERMIDGNLVQQEIVTMNAASVKSTLYYTTGEELWMKEYDGSDTSVCTQYVKWTVPTASAADIAAACFHYTCWFIDMGNTAKALSSIGSNGTTVGAAIDCSNSGYNTVYATWTLGIRALDPDSGYVNTYNFLNGYNNYHYCTVQVSGTGWDRVRIVNTIDSFERNNVHYAIIQLSDTDLTRDKQLDGSFNPTGIFGYDLTMDLTAITGGDSVSFIFSYRWYGDWTYFKTTGNWGVNSASTAQSTKTIVA